MAVPKRRMSRANTRARRSQWKANQTPPSKTLLSTATPTASRVASCAQLAWVLVEVEQF